MADDDVDVTLRLKAVDDTKRVMDDMLRRTQDFSKQLSQGLAASTTATNNLTAAMTNVGKSAEQAAKAANQNTAALNAHATATGKAASATKTHGEETAKVGAAYGIAADFALKYAGSLATVAGAIDTVTRGYAKFADSQRGMERIQLDAEATGREMSNLGDTIEKLSSITGKSGGELREAFAGFRDQTGLAFGDAVKLFDGVAKASFAAGTSIQGMSRIATAAMVNLKVPVNEMGGVLDNIVKTVPSSMMDEFASVAPRITSLLHGVGFEGKQTAEQVGVAFSTLGVKLGSTRAAANTLMEVFSKATNLDSVLGQVSIPALQKFVGDPDAFNKSMLVVYDTLKKAGLYDTKDIALKSQLMKQYDVTPQQLDGIKALKEHFDEVDKIVKETGLSVKVVERNMIALGGDAQSKLDSMGASVDSMYGSVGKLVNMTGIPSVLASTLKDWADKLRDLTTGVNAVEAAQRKAEEADQQRANAFLKRQKEIKDAQELAAQAKEILAARAAVPESEQKAEAAQVADVLKAKGVQQLSLIPTIEQKQEEDKAKAENQRIVAEEKVRLANKAQADAIKQADPNLVVTPGAAAEEEKANTPNRPRQKWFGKFATGGDFTVPGSGRGDDQPVGFMGTPGERVKIESIPAAATTESLQRQQDKADLALQEHFARFRGKTTPGVQLGKDWPHDRLGNQWPPGYRPSGGGVGGDGGTGSTGGDGRGRGRGSDGKDGTAPADGTTPGLKVPTSLDPTLETGPAETVEDARKRGYLRTEGGEGGRFTDVPELKGRGPGGKLDSGALYKTLYNNVPNELIGKVPKDGARFGITTGSREEWAKLQFKLAQQESGGRTAPPPENSRHSGTAGLYQMEAADLARWGQRGKAVTDPYAQIAAMNQVFKKNIIRDNAIGGQDTWPGRSNYGAGAYFGPLRDAGPNRGVIAKQERGAASVSAANPAPTDAAHPASVGGFKVGDIPVVGGGDQAVNTPGLNPDGSALPARIQSRSGEDPAALIAHHTSGGAKETVAGIVEYWRKGGKGIGAQYIMDHEGNIHDVKAEFGYTGTAHIKPSGVYDDSGGQSRKIADFPVGDPRRGISNANAVGMEIMASDDKHVKEIQTKKFAEFVEKRYPTTTIFGHGEVNVGHKEKDEGLKAKRAALELREQRNLTKTRVAGPPTAGPDKDKVDTAEFDAAVEKYRPAAAPAAAAALTEERLRQYGRERVAETTPAAAAALTEERLREHGQQRVAEITPVAAPSARAAQILENMRKKEASADVPAHGSASADASKATKKSTPMPRARPADAPGPAAHASAEATPEGKQSGGPIEAGKPYLVGEQGPELINPGMAGNVTSNDQLQQMMSNMREQWDRPIEPIIRPRIQQMGPLSMRWSRQSERQRSRDINRDQARAAPTDQGFA